MPEPLQAAAALLATWASRLAWQEAGRRAKAARGASASASGALGVLAMAAERPWGCAQASGFLRAAS